MATRPKKSSDHATKSSKDKDSKEKQKKTELSTELSTDKSSRVRSNADHTDGKAKRKTQQLCKDNSAATINGTEKGIGTTRKLSGKCRMNNNEEVLQQTASGKDSKDSTLSTKARETTAKSFQRSKSAEQNGMPLDQTNCGKASCVKDKTEHSILKNGPRRRNSKINEDEELCKYLKDVVNGLKMKMEDISYAAKKVNNVIDIIIKSEHTKSHPLFKSIEKMSTGSYYEGVKISDPNEFDIMLNISFESYQTVELTSIDESGAFYTLAFKKRKPPAMALYIDDEGNILAKHILDQFRTLVSNILQQSGKPALLEKKDPSSPAVTLSIPNERETISVDLVLALQIRQWPEKSNDGMNIDSWLGTKEKQKYRKEPCYMVSKRANLGKKETKDTWRISFSNIEKAILSHHGSARTCCEREGTMCCRKQCLKLMKYLLEQFKKNGNQKKMNQFCSYHAKTALFHICTKYTKDEDWKQEHLDVCFNRYVEFFQRCLKMYSLSNFFIPSHNLFSPDNVDKSSCNYLFEELEKQKIQNYPFFKNKAQQFASASSLSLDDGGAQEHD